MMRLRPARDRDLPALQHFSTLAAVGGWTLPTDREGLARRLAQSQAAFAGEAPRADAQHLFVLENAAGTVCGMSGLNAAAGLRRPWYGYRTGLAVHASEELALFTENPTLLLTNDHTGHSELCALFLDPAARRERHGALASRGRLLYVAARREHFADHLFAELRGLTDAQGRSPFWDSLGAHFFNIGFAQADALTREGKRATIAELMPRQPVYSSFLSDAAQAALGQVHPESAAAARYLADEGLRFAGYIDIFDAGPTVECRTDDARTVAGAQWLTLACGAADEATGRPWLVGWCEGGDFCAVLADAHREGDTLVLDPAAAALLGREAGAAVVAAPL